LILGIDFPCVDEGFRFCGVGGGCRSCSSR
jgi:hypothetical protein